MSNSSSNTTSKRWTRIAPGLFRDRNGTIYQVKRNGRKVVWKRLEGINGTTEMAVIADSLPEGIVSFASQPWSAPDTGYVPAHPLR